MIANKTEEPTFEIVPAELGLEPAAKSSLELAFTGFFQRAREFETKAEKVTDPKDARALRLEIKADRVATEKVRKSLKEESLRMGRAIDGANNIYLALVAPIESKLDEIEKAEERREAARIEALCEERAETLDSMGHNYHGISLGTMTEEHWKDYLQQAKDVYEMREIRKKREAEEAAAELKRQEEEREAARLEAIRVKEEQDKALAEARAEAEAARKEREAAEAKAKAEREEAEAAARAERDKLEAAAALESEKRENAEREAKALRDAEAKRIADEKAAADAKAKAEAAAARKAAAAPDKAKLMHFADIVRHLDVPLAKSEAGQAVAAEIGAKVESFAKWIEAQASQL